MAATPTTSLHVDGPPARWLLSLLPRSDNAGGLVALVPLTLDIKATGDRPCVELSAVARVPCCQLIVCSAPCKARFPSENGSTPFACRSTWHLRRDSLAPWTKSYIHLLAARANAVTLPPCTPVVNHIPCTPSEGHHQGTMPTTFIEKLALAFLGALLGLSVVLHGTCWFLTCMLVHTEYKRRLTFQEASSGCSSPFGGELCSCGDKPQLCSDAATAAVPRGHDRQQTACGDLEFDQGSLAAYLKWLRLQHVSTKFGKVRCCCCYCPLTP